MTSLSYDRIAAALNEAYADTAGHEDERRGCAIAIEYLALHFKKDDAAFDGERFIARAKNLTTIPA